ncbi:hypothetical protein VQ042_20675 [Aurantimonas sp. A2-1-M11]|uniref:hypothetical protein n=1 Tax=Aurantimonas sp. A2-1-M11 TaxID=3113712 RepID=UPI002F929E9E
MQTEIAQALLGENGNEEAILHSVDGYEAWKAARSIVEAMEENEEINGPGTYASWTDATQVIATYDGLGEAFEALPADRRVPARALIVAGVDRALGLLKTHGHLGDKALLLADELERLNDDDFEAKARTEIADELEVAAYDATCREGSAWRDFGDCAANEGMCVHVNGIELCFEYRMPQDWVSSLAREDRDEDEWEALSDAERGDLEHEALIAQIQAVREEGADVGEMWHQIQHYLIELRSGLESELAHLQYLHEEEARQAA